MCFFNPISPFFCRSIHFFYFSTGTLKTPPQFVWGELSPA
jgi:hypothetical protein